jgi:hypothetical protein
MPVIFHRADVVDGVTVRQLPWVAARPALFSPSVEQMLERLRLLWRGTPQPGGHGSPERQHDERRVAIDHGIVTAKIVLGDIVLEVKAGALFAQPLTATPKAWGTWRGGGKPSGLRASSLYALIDSAGNRVIDHAPMGGDAR